MLQQIIGVLLAVAGVVVAITAPLQHTPEPKQWLNKDVYGAERIAHWAKGEVFVWVSLAGTRFFIFRDEGGSIAAVPDFYAWSEDGYRLYKPVTRETPTKQPEEIFPPTPTQPDKGDGQ